MSEPRKSISYEAIAAFLFSAIGLVPLGLPVALIARRRIKNSEESIIGLGLVHAAFVVNTLWTVAFLSLVFTKLSRPGIGLTSKTTEAKVVLGGLRAAQRLFFDEFDNYAPTRKTPTADLDYIKVPWDAKACPSKCSRENVSACTEFTCTGYEPSRLQVYYRYACRTVLQAPGRPAQFSCGAVGDLDNNGEMGSFTYRSGNKKGAKTSTLADGISACGNQAIPVGEVWDCNPGVY